MRTPPMTLVSLLMIMVPPSEEPARCPRKRREASHPRRGMRVLAEQVQLRINQLNAAAGYVGQPSS